MVEWSSFWNGVYLMLCWPGFLFRLLQLFVFSLSCQALIHIVAQFCLFTKCGEALFFLFPHITFTTLQSVSFFFMYLLVSILHFISSKTVDSFVDEAHLSYTWLHCYAESGRQFLVHSYMHQSQWFAVFANLMLLTDAKCTGTLSQKHWFWQ